MADPLKAYLASLPEYSSARAQFLYSSLSARKAANPTGYASALSWWRLTLTSLVSKGLLGNDKLILVADEDLKEHLRWEKIGRPLSLGTVIVRRCSHFLGSLHTAHMSLYRPSSLTHRNSYRWRPTSLREGLQKARRGSRSSQGRSGGEFHECSARVKAEKVQMKPSGMLAKAIGSSRSWSRCAEPFRSLRFTR